MFDQLLDRVETIYICTVSQVQVFETSLSDIQNTLMYLVQVRVRVLKLKNAFVKWMVKSAVPCFFAWTRIASPGH